jgi:hypothetical protein
MLGLSFSADTEFTHIANPATSVLEIDETLMASTCVLYVGRSRGWHRRFGEREDVARRNTFSGSIGTIIGTVSYRKAHH